MPPKTPTRPAGTLNDLRSEKQRCAEMIGRYVAAQGKIQDQMFKSYNGREKDTYNNFYDTLELDGHIQLCENFSKCYEKPTPQGLQEICNSWDVFMAKLTNEKDNIRAAFAYIPKLVAALCLVEGRYYEAIKYLWDSIRLFSNDLITWFMLIRWLIFVNEWGILEIVLELEANTEKSDSDGYQLLMECCRLLLKLHINKSTQESVANEMADKLNVLNADKTRRTFLLAYCKIILLEGLIGDPLHNLTQMADFSDAILRNRCPEFFNPDESSSLQRHVNNVDGFVRICSSVAEYFETLQSCAEECFDYGLAREAEGYSMSLWKYGLAFGVPIRVLPSMAFVFHIKSVTTIERHMLQKFGDCINAFLTPKSATETTYVSTPKHYMFRPSLRRGSVKNSATAGIDALTTDFRKDCQLSSVNIHEQDSKEKIFLNRHNSNCRCGYCELAKDGACALFAQQIEWIQFMFADFHPVNYEKFRCNMIKLKATKLGVSRQNLFKALGSTTHIDFMPPCFLKWWFQAILCVLLQFGDSSDLNDAKKMEYLSEAAKLCETSPTTYRSTWLTLSQLQRTIIGERSTSATVANNRLKVRAEQAYFELRDYGHLFYRNWRPRICNYLAKHVGILSPNELAVRRALYYVEASVPSVRQFARLSANKKEDLNSMFHYAGRDEFMSSIKNLPSDITFVQLSISENGNLWLTRCHREHEPIVVELASASKIKPLADRLREILIQSDDSASGLCDNAQKFWENRRRLNTELEEFVTNTQESWFGHKAPLLLPLRRAPPAIEILEEIEQPRKAKSQRMIKKDGKENSKCVTKPKPGYSIMELETKFASAGFLKSSAITIARLMTELDEEEGQNLVAVFAEMDGVKETIITKIVENWDTLREGAEKDKQGDMRSQSEEVYVLLSVPPSLSFIPWECFPIFERAPLVSRIPSLHFFSHLTQNRNYPKEVDSHNSFYILDPSGDLENTQKRLTAFVEKFNWKGMTGKIPSREEVRKALTGHDLFVYLGHGSGSRYFGRSSIRECECQAVSVLMGCSSARILDEGPTFDGRAAIYEYLIARCPSILGCLWMVTDGEIDRYFMAFAEFCFGESASKEQQITEKESARSKSASETPMRRTRRRSTRGIISEDDLKQPQATIARESEFKLLIRGAVEARKACKLPFLTGGAVVSYGLPMIAATNGISKSAILKDKINI
ncbi:peptidase family c50 domain-containing protein [Ditylenchus destructor]|nr:peptidase family c50 domain-containing protein [Ditylenchus destructor]